MDNAEAEELEAKEYASAPFPASHYSTIQEKEQTE